MTNYADVSFRPAAVKPVECLKGGWELVKSQYWLFLGLTVVGMLIGALGPLGILIGPMMCGIYLAFFNTRRSAPIEFGILFKGFDYFGQSFIATLIHTVPIMMIVLPVYLLFYVGLAVTVATQRDNHSSGPVIAVFVLFCVVFLVIMFLIMLLSVFFMFSFPLIVDRGLSGIDAVKLSFKAVLANFWRLLGLMFLNWFVGLLGLCCCVVGAYFVMPATLAATAIAYEQVFGLAGPNQNLPPRPPTF
ncbi:MAG: hypothetical protein C5B55_02435 [Blastocatellia bacterium]|nr:MAG: hypothetical protein C5B55_02435 [Blastocatellia bacterium]